MDSEQLVSNPFQDMKEEAMDNAKKVSLTEKLTSVKNNVCENHLQMRNSKLHREITHKLKQIHDNASQLRYEAKVYDINKRKTDLENRKRYEPLRDFSYDESQLRNNMKRLGVATESRYLERRQQFPIRGRTVNDLHPNSTVRQARQVYQRREQQSRQNDSRFRGDFSTPGTATSSAKSKRSLLWQRRDSKSAPPASKMSKSLNFEDGSTKLPSLGEKSRVKFSLNGPTSLRTPDNLIERAKTFHPGMHRRQSRWAEGDDDDFEDDEDDEEYIDIEKLRAVLFGDKYATSKSGYDTPRTMASYPSSVPSTSRRPSHLTQEGLKKEQQELKQKIDNFFGNLNADYLDYESEPTEEDKPLPEVKSPPRLSKANLLLNVFAKSISTNRDRNRGANGQAENQKSEKERTKSACSERSKSPYNVTIKPEENKRDLWKYIKTSVQRGEIQRCQTPSRLIIQQMTHLDLTNSDKKHIPLKSANRALRHTPTFKMRQLVQRMQRERTKYEQFEIDQKKTKMKDEQMDSVEIMA